MSNPDFMHSTDAKRWASHFHTVVNQNPQLLQDEGFLIGWFANAIQRGHEDCRERMTRHASLRSRSHSALGYYISHHCDQNRVPDASASPAEMIEMINSDRGLLTMAREYLFAATRDELVFPPPDEDSGQDVF